MSFFDILPLAIRNLREAKLRAALTTVGVIVGVAMIVTMVSLGLGLQRNTVNRFKSLDLFNEITVYGRDLGSIVDAALNGGRVAAADSARPRPARGRGSRISERLLDSAAIEEITRMPGVISVEPSVYLTAYVRSNDRTLRRVVSGVLVPNPASRFKQFSQGRMINDPKAKEAVVDEKFVRDFGYRDAGEAIGKTIELLGPLGKAKRRDERANEELSFFGIPLEEDAPETSADEIVATSFHIVGVLKGDAAGGGASRARGLMPGSSVYIPTQTAREWATTYRSNLDEVALRLARESGALKAGETEGYPSATVRVVDPTVVASVRGRLTEAGFNSFSIVDQLQEIRTIFLVINSALGLLGGISLLVASFGIANTMIMSILERTSEIGIMKAIGAEDREIKLIFFVEAAVIGFVGGAIGALAASGIGEAANHIAYRFLLKPQDQSFIDFFALPAWLWLGSILFAVLIAIAAALYPAARAARIDPVKALRHD